MIPSTSGQIFSLGCSGLHIADLETRQNLRIPPSLQLEGNWALLIYVVCGEYELKKQGQLHRKGRSGILIPRRWPEPPQPATILASTP
jgi:hypothetical protein